jgi:glucosamine--fructose-6-phosphate aminotransferase (isomerizing)
MEIVIQERFPHNMIREIHEQPSAIQETLNKACIQVRRTAEAVVSGNYEMIYVVGSGTSYHAGLAGTYALSGLAGLLTSIVPASEFRNWLPSSIPKKSLLLAISQSGESSDILEAAEAAAERRIDTAALTNTPESPLATKADFLLLTYAGEERAVTATKSYTAQLTALFMLAHEISTLRWPKSEKMKALRNTLENSPRFVRETIALTDRKMYDLAHSFKHVNYFFLLGSGPNYATALEGALKFKEACNLFSEGFASREFLHGPIQLIDGGTPIIFIATEDEVERHKTLMKKMAGFGAPLISISDRKEDLVKFSTNVVEIPTGFPRILSPILYVIPLQLFAYYSSIARNLNPDKPEKLGKVVK